MAKEVASRNICVNLVAPGYITTEMTAALKETTNLTSIIPLRKFGVPQDVAEAVCFVVDSPYMTGQVSML